MKHYCYGLSVPVKYYYCPFNRVYIVLDGRFSGSLNFSLGFILATCLKIQEPCPVYRSQLDPSMATNINPFNAVVGLPYIKIKIQIPTQREEG